ncbi:MAG TPA: prenyltransferase/squalene oxidase repeat-containing protein [Pirellulales bacterium]|nr:prenyltransferase/squalene oxidase repeat-containing protein [Pirellulales bacterium]
MASKDRANRTGVEESEDAEFEQRSFISHFRDFVRTQAPWWAVSCTAHMAALAMLLLLGRMIVPKADTGDVGFNPPEAVVDASDAPVDPPIVDPGLPDIDEKGLTTIAMIFPEAMANDLTSTPGNTPGEQPPGDPLKTDTGFVGGGTGFLPSGAGLGGKPVGPIGPTGGFGAWRDRSKINIDGNTPSCDRAVVAALYWFARHQSRDGGWSLQAYAKMCKDRTCTGAADQESLSAATAMGILPYLAAGQTHLTNGPFKQTITAGIYWLVNHQKADGDLSADASGKQSWMYSHGLATIALCECYGMSHDKNVGRSAQKAVNFILAAQNTKTGGWRYHPGDDGDTSVLGWQLMALKSAQMAGLSVNPAAFDGARKWLKAVGVGGAAASASSGAASGEFAYQPDGAPSPTMSAVGLLCSQYLNAGKTDPVIVGGVRYLMANLPDGGSPNIYYWYYASQVMHNMDDHDWDVWNRKMRKILVESQSRAGCSAGSWDPDKPNRDAWSAHGGRIMTTSFATLTLEVYYRYMPLYRTDHLDALK